MPQQVLLDVMANVYNTNQPDKVPMYVDVILPAVVSGKSGAGPGPTLDFDFFLASLVDDYGRGLAPVNPLERPRRVDAGAGGAGGGGARGGGTAGSGAGNRSAIDKWSATLGGMRAPSEKSLKNASLARGIS